MIKGETKMKTGMKTALWLVMAMAMGSQAKAGMVLECSTLGDSLSAVQLEQGKKGSVLKVIHMDDSIDAYPLMDGLTNIKKGDSDTLIGSKELDKAFGGAIPKAAMMRVLPGQKKAYLSVDGMVYVLNCFPNGIR